jgi:hypothetical protein
VPDRMIVGDAASGATLAMRQQAVELIESARHPTLIPVSHGLHTVNTKTADREAQLALAAAMVYLGDIIAAHEGDDEKVDLRRWGDQKPTRSNTSGDTT